MNEVNSLLEEAYALDDAANEGSDEVLARAENYRRRNAPPRELVYKTHEPPAQPVGERAPSPASVDLDPSTQARWDAWLDQRVQQSTDMLADIIGEETALLENKLHEEISQLRADITILQGIVRGEVASIKQGKASDAA